MSVYVDLSNPSPVVHDIIRTKKSKDEHAISSSIDSQDIYDLISNIKDPEHPYTLEQLKVTEEHKIWVQQMHHFLHIKIEFTPTVPHCTLATTIGLCIREKLRRELPRFFKLDIFVTPGSHSTEFEINKQINDKERVSAAMENPYLRPIIEECIKVPE